MSNEYEERAKAQAQANMEVEQALDAQAREYSMSAKDVKTPPNPAPSRLLSQEIGEPFRFTASLNMDEGTVTMQSSLDKFTKEVLHVKESLKQEAVAKMLEHLGWASPEKTIELQRDRESFVHKWGCGHDNYGSCSQCLGRVTNERNELLIKNKVLQVSLAEQGDEIRELKESMAIYEKALKTKESL